MNTLRNTAGVTVTIRRAVSLLVIPVVTATAVFAASDASAQITACTPQVVETRLIEWDLNQAGDAVPGALAVDDRSSSRQSKLWFVTRAGETRLYRLTPGRGIRRDNAEARSWPLGALQTGGLRLRHSDDGRFAFANTNDDAGASGALVAVDTRDATRVTWLDRPQQEHMSDVSVDTRGSGVSVFTAALAYQDNMGNIDGFDGVVQRLRPGQPQFRRDASGNTVVVVPAQVTRWPVGFGAGSCTDTGPGAPCIPGIAVDRRRGHPVFFSAPQFINPNGSQGAVGELDPQPVKCSSSDSNNACAKVRYWPLPAGTAEPRQILVDDHGKVWGITSTGHLFSLEVDRSSDRGEVTRHNPIGPVEPEDLFAVAPDGGIVGFTDSQNNEVSVLFPQKVVQKVAPVVRLVRPVNRVLDGIREAAPAVAHMVAPRQANAQGTKYTIPNDGTYVETDVATGVAQDPDASQVSSLTPTGMSPDGARKTGSFFYGVGESGGTNRVGHFEVRIEPEKEMERRRDDDDFDDDGVDNAFDNDDDDDGIPDLTDQDDDNDCISDLMDKDKDNDGVEDEFDTASHREPKRIDRGTMAPGASKGYEMVTDVHSVLILAIVEAATLTTPLSIEIVDPNGVVVLSTPPVLGKAVATLTPALFGVYTVRVKNAGLSSTTYKTTLIGRQIWF